MTPWFETSSRVILTCHPAAGISGFVEIGNDVVIESGAVINNGSADRILRVGDGAIIRANAVITRDVKPGAVMMGNPARIAE